jgi:hypothetical protein
MTALMHDAAAVASVAVVVLVIATGVLGGLWVGDHLAAWATRDRGES